MFKIESVDVMGRYSDRIAETHNEFDLSPFQNKKWIQLIPNLHNTNAIIR